MINKDLFWKWHNWAQSCGRDGASSMSVFSSWIAKQSHPFLLHSTKPANSVITSFTCLVCFAGTKFISTRILFLFGNFAWLGTNIVKKAKITVYCCAADCFLIRCCLKSTGILICCRDCSQGYYSNIILTLGDVWFGNALEIKTPGSSRSLPF